MSKYHVILGKNVPRGTEASFAIEAVKQAEARAKAEQDQREERRLRQQQQQETLATLEAEGKKRREKEAAERASNAQVRDFWLREYQSYPARFRAEAIAPLQNKVGAFLSNPILRKILTQEKSGFDLRQLMDERKILLVNLAKGKIGEDTAALLGALLVTHVGIAALRRADSLEENRRDFYLYMDEFQSFTTLSLANMLSELRKYRVNLILAHQYLSQLEPQVLDAVLGNVGTLISFRLGAGDAQMLEKEFYPELTAIDLTCLPNYNIYVKLMVDGTVSRPFSAKTLHHAGLLAPQ